jgi:hypothetical protein
MGRPRQIQTIARARHIDIGQYQGECLVRQKLQGLVRAGRFHHIVTGFAQLFGNVEPDQGFIVDDKDAMCAARYHTAPISRRSISFLLDCNVLELIDARV